MRLADKIDVNTRYTRSTNVERDRGSLSIIKAYLPTKRGVELLDDVAAAFGPEDRPRAWSLTGPYGSGKSSFALFLHELLGDGAERIKAAAVEALAGEGCELANCFDKQKPWCRVVVTGSAEPLAGRLLAALDESATRFWHGKPGRKPAILKQIQRARQSGKATESQVLALIDGLQNTLERSGTGGLLLIIDELGRFLEHEVRQGTGGLFLLQELAERAFRGGKANLMLFVLLHQGFDLYARGQGEKLKNDWAKVQGRFQSISFIETVGQTLRVVAAAFSTSLSPKQRETIRRRACRMARDISAANALPSGLEEEAAADLFAACYPMHPVSLLVLPVLCQRFAQNERTLFSYLGSSERHGFRDSLQRLTKVGEWVHPGTVYDYFVHNQPTVLADPLTHRRWAEVVTAVERAEHASDATDECEQLLHLAKTVGLLNLISGSDGLCASESVLSLLFPTKKSFRGTMQRLLDASIVQYRKFSGEYRVWQGTDFNIDEQTHIESDKLGYLELAATLGQRTASRSVVARRHSIMTGALRYFDVSYVDAQSCRLIDTNSAPPPRKLCYFSLKGATTRPPSTPRGPRPGRLTSGCCIETARRCARPSAMCSLWKACSGARKSWRPTRSLLGKSPNASRPPGLPNGSPLAP